MKTLTTVRKLTGALLAGALLMLFGNAANASTASGTPINNFATVSYSVNSISQSPITSATATFNVDKFLQLQIARSDAAKVIVTPGQTTAGVLTFTVTNNGNSPEDFSLAGVAEANGTVDPFGTGNNDSFDGATMNVFADSNGNGTYDAGVDNKASSSNLLAGASIKVFLVITGSPAFAANLTDAQVAVYGMKATVDVLNSCATACVAETQDTTTNKNTNLTTVLNVFADGIGTDDNNRDGVVSARDAFVVNSAKLTITKVSTVVSDPINGVSTPRAIPGAVMQYTITVANAANTGSVSATSVGVSDSLASQIGTTTTWNTGSLSVAISGGGVSINPCADNGTTVSVSGGVSCDYNKTAATTVTLSGMTIPAGQQAVITYQVTIK